MLRTWYPVIPCHNLLYHYYYCFLFVLCLTYQTGNTIFRCGALNNISDQTPPPPQKKCKSLVAKAQAHECIAKVYYYKIRWTILSFAVDLKPQNTCSFVRHHNSLRSLNNLLFFVFFFFFFLGFVLKTQLLGTFCTCFCTFCKADWLTDVCFACLLAFLLSLSSKLS